MPENHAATPPDVVIGMSEKAHQNQWKCWVQEIPSDLFTDWAWIKRGKPADQAMLVIQEIARLCMLDIDVGLDGIPVITFSPFELEPPNLHASLFDLVQLFIESVVDGKGHIDSESCDNAIRLAQGLERAAAMIRERLP